MPKVQVQAYWEFTRLGQLKSHINLNRKRREEILASAACFTETECVTDTYPSKHYRVI